MHKCPTMPMQFCVVVYTQWFGMFFEILFSRNINEAFVQSIEFQETCCNPVKTQIHEIKNAFVKKEFHPIVRCNLSYYRLLSSKA